ncbi:MAG: Stp1/IreP family PP2C-type Ser/Thr phosphatase [Acidobacteriota bacterium]|nr:Stp1/IreP family PP2C-type Ser/Thr phosphatase [Acidobacteriota bacterium]
MYRFHRHTFPGTQDLNGITTSIEFASMSHVGRIRQGNEDASAVDAARGLFIVCDGMGGAAAGEIASCMAVDSFHETVADLSAAINYTPREQLERAVKAANKAVFAHGRQSHDLRGMGTTLVALLLEETDSGLNAWIANVGDSRCYRMRGGRFEQLTHDHSLVEEQVRAGQLTAAEAERSPMRNVITRAIGSYANVDPDILCEPTVSGDLYLLCSDGLTRDLRDAQIAALLEKETNLTTACRDLVQNANDAGGGDNITCILVRISA